MVFVKSLNGDALVVIDVQNDFIDPSSPLCVAGGASIVPQVIFILLLIKKVQSILFYFCLVSHETCWYRSSVLWRQQEPPESLLYGSSESTRRPVRCACVSDQLLGTRRHSRKHSVFSLRDEPSLIQIIFLLFVTTFCDWALALYYSNVTT